MTSPDPLELRATAHRVRVATTAAELGAPAVTRAVQLAVGTPPRSAWRDFLAAALALLGGALVLAGVVCFVAFNWTRIGRYGKFALVELAIVAAVLVAWKKLPALSGRISLFGGAVLVGPLLAIYGQTYQTGADPYGLFLVWAGLIVPWAVLGRFAATWVLVILLLDTSLILFYAQVWAPRNTSNALLIPISIGVLHVLALVAWEWQLRRPSPYLREAWAARVVALAMMAALFIPWAVLVLGGTDAGLTGLVGAAIFALLIFFSLRYHRDRRPDRFMVALAGVAAMAAISVIAGRIVFQWLDMGSFGAVVMAIFVLWQVAFGVKLFREMRAS